MATQTTTLNQVDIGAVAGLAAKIQQAPEAASTTWTAVVNWEEGFRSTATIRDFDPVLSDEPAGLGGTDLGPNPVEQLLGALGNCLAVGYAANATAASIELEELQVEVAGDLDLHTFLGLNPDGNAGFQSITAAVKIRSNASADQLAALHAQVVSTSPVGHTLSREVPLEVELA